MIRSQRLGALMLTLILAGSLIACGKNLTPAEHIAKAKDQLDAGELPAAKIELSNALQKDPNVIEARWLLGKVLLELGDGAGSEKEIRRAVTLGLPIGEVQASLVKAIYLQGDLDRVLAESAAVAPTMQKSDQATILGFRGLAYGDKREFSTATKALEQSLELDPKNIIAMLGMSTVQGFQLNLVEARRWADSALQVNPQSAEAWSLMGDIELAEGQLSKAETAFSKTLEYRKYPSVDIAKRAMARIQLKNYEGAAADIESLKKKGLKDHPYVNYIAGLNNFQQAKYKEALEAFQSAYNKSPDLGSLLYYLAATHYVLGNMEQANDFAGKLYAAAPNSLAATKLLGSVQLSRSELGSANEILEKALVKAPNDAALLQMLASSAMLQGKFDKGIKYYERILEKSPDSAVAKSQIMLGKLLSGGALSASEASTVSGGAGGAEGDFTREFLLAAASFRDGKIGDALKRAQALQTKFPTKTDPTKLVAACYLAAAQWKPARVELNKVLKLDPNDASALMNLARIEVQEKNLGGAHELLAQLMKANPKNEAGAIFLAEVETRKSGVPAGIQSLEQSLAQFPGGSQIRAELAAAYLQEGKINKVIENTQNLSNAQVAKQPRLLELKGKAEMLSGNVSVATQSFQRWSEVQPESAQAHFFYGDALARGGRSDEAQKQLAKALSLDVNYLPARVGEIKMLVQKGKLDPAKIALTKLKKDFGSRAEVLDVEGWFALGARDYPKAVQALTGAFEKAPSTESLLQLVQALSAQQKYDEAISKMLEWLNKHPGDLPVLSRLAGGYLTKGQEDKAIETYRKINESAPNHIPTLNNLAWLSRDKDLNVAMKFAEHAHQLSAEDPFVLDTYGMLTIKAKKTEEGIKMLRDAVKKMPKNWEFRLHLGQALADAKHVDEAKQELKTVVDKAPDSEFAKQAKSVLATMNR